MKILIVKTSALGDIIHAFPAIGFIKAKFPHAQIDWVVESPFAALVKAHPDIYCAIEIDTKLWRRKSLSSETIRQMKTFRRQLQQKRYDVVFDLQGNCKSGLATWLSNSSIKVGFNLSYLQEWPNVLATNKRFSPLPGKTVRADYLHLIQAHFNDFSPYSYPGITLKLTEEENFQFEKIAKVLLALPAVPVMVCPGSNWKNKQLSESALQDVLTIVMQNQHCSLVFLWGTDAERCVVESLSKKLQPSIVLDKMSLPLLQNVMSKVQLVIAMDSLALHLAATTPTSTFSVFGASCASKYKPEGGNHIAVQGSCPYGQKFERRCPKLRSCSTGACIRSLSGDTLAPFVKVKVLSQKILAHDHWVDD